MERAIQKAANETFEMMPGVRAYRNNTGSVKRGKCFIEYGLRSHRGETGGADNILCVETRAFGPRVGLFVGVELKDRGCKPDPDQYEWAQRLEQEGAGIWIWGDDMQTIANRIVDIQRTGRAA